MTYDPDKLERCEACGTLLEGGVPVDERDFADARAVWKEQIAERSMQFLGAMDALGEIAACRLGVKGAEWPSVEAKIAQAALDRLGGL